MLSNVCAVAFHILPEWYSSRIFYPGMYGLFSGSLLFCWEVFEIMEYPIFTLSEDGTIGSSGTVVDDNVQSVSGGDASGSAPSTLTADDVAAVMTAALDENLAALQGDVSYLASEAASGAGYISSTILETFDRVLQQYDFDYYCAYRTGDDNYSAVLYLSDTYSYNGSTLYLDDVTQVELYRANVGTGYNNYEYRYNVSSAGDVDIRMDRDLMYYTNCVPGYPALGEVSAPTKYSQSTSFVICLLVIIVFLLFRRPRK